jgi:hypothetical protein
MPSEKDEKFDEKEREKSAEKSWDEKWSRDPLTPIIWALVFIWAGIVLLLSNLGMLDQFLQTLTFSTGIESIDKTISAWPIILIGAGCLFLLEVLLRLIIPAYRRPVGGTLIFAFILIAIGLNSIIGLNWVLIWPMILIAIGLSILLRGITRKRE